MVILHLKYLDIAPLKRSSDLREKGDDKQSPPQGEFILIRESRNLLHDYTIPECTMLEYDYHTAYSLS